MEVYVRQESLEAIGAQDHFFEKETKKRQSKRYVENPRDNAVF